MLKVLSLFSGIGAFEKALENIDEPFELINYCEIDKYASKAFSLIHAVNEGLNLGDITTIDTGNLPNDIDVITYGFPCQDISCAGKQKGFTDENGDLTRSGLFFEALRIIEDTKPKFAIAENVKALTGKRLTAEFKIVLDSLNDAGYKNYWAVLNAKDYGIPQNRERVFIISIRNDINHGFNFPKPYELKLKLKDVLETNVDEKFFLTDEMMKKFIVFDEPTQGETKQIGNRKPNSKTRLGRVGKNVAQTLLCGDENDVVIKWRCMNKDGYKIATEGDGIVTSRPHQARSTVMKQCSFAIRAQNAGDSGVCVRTGEQLSIRKLTPKEATTTRGQDIASTIRASIYKQGARNLMKNVIDGGGYEGVIEYSDRLRIRKLTPKECFRLMGFADSDIDVLVDNGMSNTQLYKMAGNSIVVDVLEEIFVELLNQYNEVV